ncbi:MAG: glycosidase [Thermoprotei archaeon]|nr:MAG: glycosidase [Thermoprotei archaeon]
MSANKLEASSRQTVNRQKYIVILIVVLAAIVLIVSLSSFYRREVRYAHLNLKRYVDNPVIFPDGEGFDASATFNPAAVVKDGKVYLFYRAQEVWFGTSVIGLAVSEDGFHFEKMDEPIIVPEYEWELLGGCEDPRIVKINDTYYMTYTAYDKKVARLALARSKDLIHWEKLGIVFPEWGWSKSGAIIPVKINGYYWMYFGDSSIWIARSKDMVHWETDRDWIVLKPRRGYFDSKLVEPGPPPIIVGDKILLIYNGADDNLVYSVGWAIFSLEDPTKLIARAEKPILTPETYWEKFGQVRNVVFAEGLVYFNGKWFLYYGAADTFVCVAVADSLESLIGYPLRSGG